MHCTCSIAINVECHAQHVLQHSNHLLLPVTHCIAGTRIMKSSGTARIFFCVGSLLRRPPSSSRRVYSSAHAFMLDVGRMRSKFCEVGGWVDVGEAEGSDYF